MSTSEKISFLREAQNQDSCLVVGVVVAAGMCRWILGTVHMSVGNFSVKLVAGASQLSPAPARWVLSGRRQL